MLLRSSISHCCFFQFPITLLHYFRLFAKPMKKACMGQILVKLQTLGLWIYWLYQILQGFFCFFFRVFVRILKKHILQNTPGCLLPGVFVFSKYNRRNISQGSFLYYKNIKVMNSLWHVFVNIVINWSD